MTKRTPPYSPEVRARAVRMVLDHQGEHASQWAAINSIAAKIGCSDTVDWDDLARTRRSVREYLDTLDEAAWGVASEVAPKYVSRSDPAAQWTGAMKGHAFFAYATNYLIDLDNPISS